MKPLLRLITMALVIIFAFSSVAWAGTTKYIDLQQDQSKIGLSSEQELQPYAPIPPEIKKKPPDVKKPPIIKKPPITQKPPIIKKPPTTQKPPVIKKPPTTIKPPVIKKPPTTHKPPVIHNPPSKHRPPVIYNPDHHKHWNHDWPHDRPWHHHFNDWNWFVGFGVLNLGAYYLDDNYDRIMYVHFEPENKTYLQEVMTRYGDYSYRERIFGFDGEGWRYYWTGEQNIICVFVRDDGYTHTFIWNRAETEKQGISLGLLTEEQLAVYSPYNADMPPILAEEYINLVIWSQTEWK